LQATSASADADLAAIQREQLIVAPWS